MAESIRSTLGAFFGAVTLLVASSSVAQTVSVPSAGGIASVEIDDSAPRAGTTVSSPNTKLSAFSLSLVASTSKLTVRPQVYAVAGGVVGGQPHLDWADRGRYAWSLCVLHLFAGFDGDFRRNLRASGREDCCWRRG